MQAQDFRPQSPQLEVLLPSGVGWVLGSLFERSGLVLRRCWLPQQAHAGA